MSLLIPRINEKMQLSRGFSKGSRGWSRVEYFTKPLEIWIADENPLFALFGGAPGYSGARYMFTSVDNIPKTIESDPYWTVESDWCSIIIGRGLYGFAVYCILFFSIFNSRKIKRKNKIISLIIFTGGIGYLYDTAIFTGFLLYFVGQLNIPNKNTKVLK